MPSPVQVWALVAEKIGAAITAGRQNGFLRAEAVQRAVIKLPRGDAPAGAVLVHDEIKREILDEELGRVAQRLAIERVQDCVAGTVSRRAGALDRAFAVILRHAAKGALIDLALFGAREGYAPVLQLVHGGRRLAAQIFNRVLITQPV